MKIAFIDHLQVGTGIIRFSTQLARSILTVDNNVELTFFTHYSNYEKNRELFDFNSSQCTLEIIKSTIPKTRLYYFLERVLKKTKYSGFTKLKKELEAIRGFDVVYFTCPHMSDHFEIPGKKFGTFHDFNWKYSFGIPNFSGTTLAMLTKAMPSWFSNTIPIASTNFIKSEIDKFYPAHKYPVEVIYLANPGKEILSAQKETYDFPYILYPANTCSHKNHVSFYRAFYLLKQDEKFRDLKIILTGAGTDYIKYGSVTEYGIESSGEQDYNVLGLGYVDNNTVDNLIKNATLSVSASLYEAGSGPAIDSWINKVPFIMSDIPSHREQLSFFNVETILFDPLSPVDISEKIRYALENISLLKEMSVKGYHALKKYSWEQVAAQYLNVFTKYSNGN